MTSQSPRICIYKITFEEVPYYYYGVHKEKYFNGYYMGTPVTHKWCWDFYTPKKQILQFFEFSDNGWLEAQEVEGRLIQPVFNTDKWCLNENCGGKISLKISREVGLKNKENGTGFYNRTSKQHSEDSIKGGKIGGKITNSQRWVCLETGYVSNAGALSHYQNHRGIDTSKRKRIS